MKYQRVLLKLSGESLAKTGQSGIDPERLNYFAGQISELKQEAIQMGIVIGGGNIFRGLSGASKGFDRVNGDKMGMLATVINSIALVSAIEDNGMPAKLFTAVEMPAVGTRFEKSSVSEALHAGKICVFSGGTGNPFFSTDTASALRAVEISADVFLKGTRVDGIYDKDPEKYHTAIKFDSLSFNEAYEKQLKIMDLTAFALCRENNLPVLVFDMNQAGNLKKAVFGEKIGTLVHN